MRVGEALALARPLQVARLDAQLLLAFRLQRDRAWLLAHDDDALDDDAAAAYAADLAQCAAGMPLAYLVGEREFHGLSLRVTPAVLVPRPDTELLVDWAIERAAEAALAVVDLGTGSGAIALAVKHGCPRCHVVATDTSAAALAVARENAQRLGLEVEFVAGDWWQALAGRHFDLVLSNPPYIAGDDPHLPALRFEPRSALTPEGDGLAALQQIVDGAPMHLRSGGWLLLEHGWEQASAVQGMLSGTGFAEVQTRLDFGVRLRCTGGRWPG